MTIRQIQLFNGQIHLNCCDWYVISPGFPGGPCLPDTPWNPFSPGSPFGPNPGGPGRPLSPGGPWGPVSPEGPRSPLINNEPWQEQAQKLLGYNNRSPVHPVTNIKVKHQPN